MTTAQALRQYFNDPSNVPPELAQALAGLDMANKVEQQIAARLLAAVLNQDKGINMLVGKHFYTYHEGEVDLHGRVIAQLSDTFYLVEVLTWISAPSFFRTVSIAAMADWKFYDTEKIALEAWHVDQEYGDVAFSRAARLLLDQQPSNGTNNRATSDSDTAKGTRDLPAPGQNPGRQAPKPDQDNQK